MKEFILGYWCNSKMHRIQRFCFNFSIKSIINLNVTKNDLLSAIDALEGLERSARIFDRRNSGKYFQLQSLLILILNIILAFHFLLLSITDNQTIIFYSGDFFVSSSERKVLNYILHCGIIMPCMVKIFLLYLHQSGRKSFLHILDEYKGSLKESNKKFSYSLKDEKLFRKSYYLAIKLYEYIFIGVYGVLLLLHLTNITIIYNHSTLQQLILQMIHMAILVILYYPILSSALWFVSMLLIMGILAYFAIDSLKVECDELISLGNYTRHHAESFFYKQSLLSNWMDWVNARAAWIFITFYAYGCFHNILILFCLTQFKYDNLGVKMLLSFAYTLILAILYANNYSGTLIGQKASVLHRSIYRLSINTGKLFNIKVALKKLQTLERLASRKMGVYIGNYIYVGNYTTLLLALECGSLYYLFCANIN
uniref:Gustatory receptor n=1 Tax=Tetranychus urticae TaxID=32264 RepID=T1KAR6_TETUR